jgi:hypothetical protein
MKYDMANAALPIQYMRRTFILAIQQWCVCVDRFTRAQCVFESRLQPENSLDARQTLRKGTAMND